MAPLSTCSMGKKNGTATIVNILFSNIITNKTYIYEISVASASRAPPAAGKKVAPQRYSPLFQCDHDI